MYLGDGTLRVRYIYDSWGNTISIQDGNGQELTGPNDIANRNPFRYRGYYFDSETGLYYLQNRYYDPQTCRFVNGDGYVSTGKGFTGNNMFAYCLNNPVNCTEPSGKLAATATVAGSAIGFILRELGKALLGLMAGYLIADTLVNNPPASTSISIPENTKPETDEKEKDITIPPKNGRIIEWRDPIAKRKYSNGMKILIMVYIIIQCWLSGMESITICTIFRVLQCRNHGIQCIWEVNYGNRCIKWQNY